MRAEREKKLSNTSRQAEESYLEATKAVISHNLVQYGQQVTQMREEIDDMLEHFHDDNPELINQLENTITMHDHLKRALERNERAQNKPYFGRIIFHDEMLDKEESLYIGKGGISKDATSPVVIDWRAPVANAYYENGLGHCSYPSPEGKQIPIELQLKRTYEIEEGRLLGYFDSEVIANDELLTKYLAKNKQAVLGEIVATIQKEQNDIIRKTPYHNCLVQGVAGSGKTTVAMHRISYILYNYAERFKPDDFYIVGSNRILLNYITGVLPDLDVYGVRQMTMEQLFVRLLYEDWDEKKYRIKEVDHAGQSGAIKGSLAWFRDLEDYCNRLEWKVIPRESIYLNPRQYVEGIRDGKAGVFDETEGKTADSSNLVLLVDGSAVERYIRQNPTVSVQNKILMLNERLTNKVKDEFLGKGVKYTELEKKAILKAYRGRYGANVWKKSIFAMYEEFLERQIRRGYDVELPGSEFDVYDLAALAYLYKRVKEAEVISEAHHVVIDEAQDFGMMAYAVLKYCIKDCTYTIMGDVSQNIHFGYGLNDWEELKAMYLSDEKSSFCILKKSYRNTIEISDFATRILHHGRFSSYPVEPIIRHGKPVEVLQIGGDRAADRMTDRVLDRATDKVADRVLDRATDRVLDRATDKAVDRATYAVALIQKAAAVCKNWQKNGLDTIAVICRNQERAARAAQELKAFVEIMESDLEKAQFGNGILVLPVEYTKGLEFDAVLILDPTREEYPVEDGHAKLLYVAATRALHELCVLHTGNLTGLIADPIPEKKDTGSDRLAGRITASTARPEVQSGTRPTITARPTVQSGTRPTITARPTVQSGTRPMTSPARPAVQSVSRLATSPAKPVAQSVARPAVPSARPAARLGAQPTASAAAVSAPAANPAMQTAVNPAQILQRSSNIGAAFGDLPTTEKLRPMGHTRIDLAIRWVMKQPDGLYLQSRYGVLRLSPVGSDIIRITFAKGSRITDGIHPQIAVRSTYRAWMYRETAKAVELVTDEILVQVDKATGAIQYLTRDKKLLLKERSKESRQLESLSAGKWCSWLYLDWQKGEKLYSLKEEEQIEENPRGKARYISRGGIQPQLPFIFSDRGYGILLACGGAAMYCDIPTYGSYLYMEGVQTKGEQMDYYFIEGKKVDKILAAYGYLCGSSIT